MTWTPWGASQSSKQWARGIMSYSTAGHGGFSVTPAKHAEMLPELGDIGHFEYDKYWFEEDCAYAAVVLAFPELFSDKPEVVTYAAKSLQTYHPAAHAAWLAATVAESKLNGGK